MKLLSVVGARPQFVKEAMVQHEIRKHHDIKQIVVHTGQHYDRNMSDVFFEVLDMQPPNYNLAIGSASHGEMTGKMIISLEKVMLDEKPDVVVLYGDTNSTLAGAIAAAKLRIDIAHIEAGLRSGLDTPEELNRVLTDRVSDHLFVPSLLGAENLKLEGISKGVHVTGDVMYDVFLKMQPRFDYSPIAELGLRQGQFIVLTLHRGYNVDLPERLSSIMRQVARVSKEIPVVFPVHPRTRKRIKEFGLQDLLHRIIVIEPVNYLQLMALTQYCHKVITDSGGYQKEAYFSGKQALVVAPNTSWRELVDSGSNVLVDESSLYERCMDSNVPTIVTGIYGDGIATAQIVRILRA